MNMENPKTRTLHSLALPYPQPEWPCVTPEIEDALLTLLLPLLRPIGYYRKTSQHTSHRRRKRNKDKGSEKKSETPDTVPQMPNIIEHLTIGFNSTVRQLEDLSKPTTFSAEPQSRLSGLQTSQIGLQKTSLAVVFVCQKAVPDLVCESFPLLVASASLHIDGVNRIRLIPISSESERLIAQSLSQPRVAVLGLNSSAPGSESLLQYLRHSVQEVQAPWLEQNSSVEYLPVKIKEAEVLIGTTKARKQKNGDKQ